MIFQWLRFCLKHGWTSYKDYKISLLEQYWEWDEQYIRGVDW